MESKKLLFTSLPFLPRYPSRFMFGRNACIGAHCMDVWYTFRARATKKKIIRRRENIVQKNVIRNCLVGNLYRKMCEVVCKRFEAEFLFFCVLLDNYFVSYIRWWIGMFESQSLTVLASTRRFLQQSYFSLNFQFFPEKKKHHITMKAFVSITMWKLSKKTQLSYFNGDDICERIKKNQKIKRTWIEKTVD